MERIEKQLTAVEWLLEELLNRDWYHLPESIKNEIIEQAKEMEKQKLEQFYNHGQWAIIEHGHGEMFEDYYNRTFKSE
jgi:hypothetical protein